MRKAELRFNSKGMASERPRVRLKDIAERLGVSVQTVSLALRGHREVSEQTREKICAVANEMGYAADPAMSALAAYRTQTRKAGRKWDRIAYVHDWPSNRERENNAFDRSIAENVVKLAVEKGMSVEIVWLGRRSEHAQREFRRLSHAGIEGIIVAPHAMELEPTTVPIPTGKFYVVTCGPEHLYENFHTVQFDYFENFRLAWAKLKEKGYQRIALAYDHNHHWRTGHAWFAAYFVEMYLDGKDPIEVPPFAVNHSELGAKAKFGAWLKEHQPEAIISSSQPAVSWAKDIAPEVFMAKMNPSEPGLAGVDINIPLFAECLVNTLMNEMQRGLYSEDNPAYRIHIPGRWTDGEGA